MNLECLNDIITSNLAIHIDLTNLNSWDLNTGLTSFSLTKWSGAVADNINLMDFGLTAFDNGRMDAMWEGIELTPEDNVLSMYRVGYNDVQNPSTGETTGVTVNTQYLPISAITTGTSGNYFDLNGGYLQGFFNLEGFNYQLLPTRYGKGITIETLVYLYPDSHGIFYMMGARAEDKYNPFFSGETMTGKTITGINTSFDNYLDALQPKEVLNKAFTSPEDNMTKTVYSETPPIDNIKSNVIAFELTQDHRLTYKYVDDSGLIQTNTSSSVVSQTGFTMISIVFTPEDTLSDEELECAERRTGKLIFYVNGRAVWINHDFPEFYFSSFNNDKEKQEGVPYSISWGGGSFGLAESWHYDYQTYVLYDGQDTAYINNAFMVEPDPIPTNCYDPPTGDTSEAGFVLSADSTTFTYTEECDPDTELPLTVMRMDYTGGTASTYFLKFLQPVSVLSNRDYVVDVSLYVDNIFSEGSTNSIGILMYSDDVDISMLDDVEYVYPPRLSLIDPDGEGEYPFPDREEYMWSVDGILYYGETGYPVTRNSILSVGSQGVNPTPNSINVSGENKWVSLKSTFRTPDNTGQQFVSLGLLIETTGELLTGGTIYINGFEYTASDILVQDPRKSGLTIENNFDSGFIGGIQKLRVYDRAFTAPEILHNALMESNKNSDILVSKGGRIIYR
jgi:hypothetical protein